MIATYTLGNQAVLHFFVGFAFALLNVVIRYFAHWFPRIISVVPRHNVLRALIIAYLVALVLQLLTSPLFATVFHPKYVEFAWSPYEAFFNVVGVLAMDVIMIAWGGIRRGAEIGSEKFVVAKTHAAAEIDELTHRHGPTTTSVTQTEAEARAAAERKQRVDDQLKDF